MQEKKCHSSILKVWGLEKELLLPGCNGSDDERILVLFVSVPWYFLRNDGLMYTKKELRGTDQVFEIRIFFFYIKAVTKELLIQHTQTKL